MKKIITLLLATALVLSLLFALPVMGADALLTPGDNWFYEVSSEIGWGPINNAFDGDITTYWHTLYIASGTEIIKKDKCPHIITVTFDEVKTISGWRYTPRQDNPVGSPLSYNIHLSADGKNFKKVYSGTFKYLGGVKDQPAGEARWTGANAKAVRIEFLSTIGDFGTAAEIQFYGGAAGAIEQNTSKNTANNTTQAQTTPIINATNLIPIENLSLSATFAGKDAKGAVDGKEDTYFITGKNNNLVEITLAEETMIAGFSYTPREEGNEGIWTSYSVYGSADGENFVKLGAGTFDYGHLYANRNKKVGAFGMQASVKKLRINITTPDGFISAAEIGLLAQNGSSVSSSPSDTNSAGNATDSSEAENGVLTYDSSWDVKASSEIGWGGATLLFDGDTSTHWHTFYIASGTTITQKDEVPHVITVTFPKNVDISGWRYTPRQDTSAAGTITEYNIYGSKDGKSFEKIYSGTFGYDGSATARPSEEAYWGKSNLRAIRIEATKTMNGFGSGAEIEFLTADVPGTATGGTKTEEPKTEDSKTETVNSEGMLKYNPAWKISASSSISWGDVKNAFDGDAKTHWHTYYKAEGTQIIEKDETPHTITVTFPGAVDISGWRYTPRSESVPGTVLAYTVYASSNGTNFEKIYDGNFAYKNEVGNQPMEASWDTVKARAIKLEFTQTIGGYGVAAEIQFKGEDADGDKYDGYASDGTPRLARKNWKIEASSQMGWGPPTLMLDGDKSTNWHTFYKAEGPTIVEKDEEPHTIDVTLPELTTISGFSIVPRDGTAAGRFLNYDVYVSETLDGEFVKLAEYADADNTKEKEHIFTANIDIRRIRFVGKHTKEGFGVIAELYLMAENPEKDKIKYSEFAEHDAENRLYEIDSTLFTAEQNGIIWGEHDPTHLFDGMEDMPSRWYQTEIGKDFVITVDMKDVYTIKEIDYVPRQSADLHGHWLLVNIYYSTDGETWVEAFKNLELEASLDTKKFVFDKEIDARYVEFEIIKSVTNRCSAHEINFYQTKAAHDGVTAGKEEKYVLTIGKNEIAVTKNGATKTVTLDAAPYIVNGTTLIPLRGLLEEMGKSVSWDGKNQTISVDNGTITLQIHNRLVYVKDDLYGTVRYTLLAVPVITDNRTFIPVRFVSEQLGYDVTWNGATGEIVITK